MRDHRELRSLSCQALRQRRSRLFPLSNDQADSGASWHSSADCLGARRRSGRARRSRRGHRRRSLGSRPSRRALEDATLVQLASSGRLTDAQQRQRIRYRRTCLVTKPAMPVTPVPRHCNGIDCCVRWLPTSHSNPLRRLGLLAGLCFGIHIRGRQLRGAQYQGDEFRGRIFPFLRSDLNQRENHRAPLLLLRNL